MGDEIKIIGGVRILQSNIEQELPPVTKSEVGPNNVYTEYREYRVKLKGGTVLRFRDQAEANEAEVKFLENSDGQREITFFGLNGAVITDTEENDNYNLSGCSGVTVNAGRTKSLGGGCTRRHRVGTDGDKITQSDRELSNGEIQKSFGNVAYTFGRGDKVSGGISSVDKNTNILADQENNPFEPKLTTTKIGRRLAKGNSK